MAGFESLKRQRKSGSASRQSRSASRHSSGKRRSRSTRKCRTRCSTRQKDKTSTRKSTSRRSLSNMYKRKSLSYHQINKTRSAGSREKTKKKGQRRGGASSVWVIVIIFTVMINPLGVMLSTEHWEWVSINALCHREAFFLARINVKTSYPEWEHTITGFEPKFSRLQQ